jgi:hypothetical protein
MDPTLRGIRQPGHGRILGTHYHKEDGTWQASRAVAFPTTILPISNAPVSIRTDAT